MSSHDKPGFGWLLIDGLSEPLARGFAARHPASFMARCFRDAVPGRRARPLRPLSPNCQTPPSLFTIWSGLMPEDHGVVGYDVPAPTPADLLTHQPGFVVWPREPLMAWDRLAAAGASLRLCAMPFVQPERLGRALRSWTNPYGAQILPAAVLEPDSSRLHPQLGIGGDIVEDGDVLRLRVRSADGDTGLVLSAGDTGLVAVRAPASPGPVSAQVACIQVQGGLRLVVFARHEVRIGGADPGAVTVARDTAARCLGGDVARLYQLGRLGPRLSDGGAGEAERCLVELLQISHQAFAQEVVAAMGATDSSHVFAYYPLVDLLSHHLLRHVHPATSRPDHRALCEALFDRLLGDVDALMAACLEAAPGRPLLAHSDHGMLPVLNDVHVNRAFEHMGLLRFDADQRIDLARSAIFLHPCESGLLVHDPVRLACFDRSLSDVILALRELLPPPLRDGWTILPGPAAPLPGDWHADRYLQAPPAARWRAARGEALVATSGKGGDHSVAHDDAWLRGVLFLAGQADRSLPPGELELASLGELLPMPSVQ